MLQNSTYHAIRIASAIVMAARDRWPTLTSGTYAVAWLLAAVVTIVSGLFAGALGEVAIIGFVLAAPVSFYATVVTASLYARGVTESVEGHTGDGVEPDGRLVA